jgi:hypothetical protein
MARTRNRTGLKPGRQDYTYLCHGPELSRVGRPEVTAGDASGVTILARTLHYRYVCQDPECPGTQDDLFRQASFNVKPTIYQKPEGFFREH